LLFALAHRRRFQSLSLTTGSFFVCCDRLGSERRLELLLALFIIDRAVLFGGFATELIVGTLEWPVAGVFAGRLGSV